MAAGAEFEVVEAALEAEMTEQYSAAASMWNQLRREFLYAAEKAEDADKVAGLPKKRGSLLWRSFWASHQRFFRHMCMAAKVCLASCRCHACALTLLQEWPLVTVHNLPHLGHDASDKICRAWCRSS